MRRADLLDVAGRVAGILGTEDCVLVGGLAVGAHGYVRATKDVDFVARPPLAEVRRRLADGGISALLARGDPLEGDFPCVKASVDGIRVDVMPPLVPLDWERAVAVPLARERVLRVVDLDGLLRLKLRAGGPRDLMDVAALVLQHREHEPPAREEARAYGLAEKLDVWLQDPRLRAEVRDAQVSRSRLRSAKRPGRKRSPPRGR